MLPLHNCLCCNTLLIRPHGHIMRVLAASAAGLCALPDGCPAADSAMTSQHQPFDSTHLGSEAHCAAGSLPCSGTLTSPAAGRSSIWAALASNLTWRPCSTCWSMTTGRRGAS